MLSHTLDLDKHQNSSINSEWLIILVDDNCADLEIAAKTLEKCDYTVNVKCFENGKEFLNYLKLLNSIDRSTLLSRTLIMLDINMPGSNGINLLSKIKDNIDYCHIPVIMLTGDCSTESILKTYDMKADGYLSKPFCLEHLNKINRFLGEHL